MQPANQESVPVSAVRAVRTTRPVAPRWRQDPTRADALEPPIPARVKPRGHPTYARLERSHVWVHDALRVARLDRLAIQTRALACNRPAAISERRGFPRPDEFRRYRGDP